MMTAEILNVNTAVAISTSRMLEPRFVRFSFLLPINSAFIVESDNGDPCAVA